MPYKHTVPRSQSMVEKNDPLPCLASSHTEIDGLTGILQTTCPGKRSSEPWIGPPNLRNMLMSANSKLGYYKKCKKQMIKNHFKAIINPLFRFFKMDSNVTDINVLFKN